MKINRLLEITVILINRGMVTAKELSDRFGVSTRTIYRDVDVLSTAGVPVFTNKGNGGGISLLENYSLNKTLITEHESESVLLALKTLQATKYPDIDMVLDKIGSVFKKAEALDWVTIDFAPWGSRPNEYNKFIDIKRAILERKTITFNYVGSDGGRSKRTIEPMKLVFRGQAWYLWGYCRTRMDFRMFRISRIKGVCVNNESFSRKKLPDPGEFIEQEASKKLVALKLKFRPEVLHRLYDDFDDDLINRNNDGTCTVSITFPEDEWVYGYLLSYGSYVEVLEPEYIQKIIIDRMKKAIELYPR